MSEGVVQTLGLYDNSGTIALDHPCKRCGYNLRGLRETGRCPECGTPVGLSTSGDLLRFGHPDWLAKVARGMSIVLWMVLVGIVMQIASAVLGAKSSPAFAQAVLFASNLLEFYGVWLLTEPDPSGIGEDKYVNARRTVRFALLVGLVSQVVEAATEVAGASPKIKMLILIVTIPATLIGLVGEFAKFGYCQMLARRIPDDFLEKRARFLKWGFTVTMAIVALAAVATLAVAAAGATGVGTVLCISAPTGIALIVFTVMTLSLLIKLRRSIREQARISRDIWQAGLEAAGCSVEAAHLAGAAAPQTPQDQHEP